MSREPIKSEDTSGDVTPATHITPATRIESSSLSRRSFVMGLPVAIAAMSDLSAMAPGRHPEPTPLVKTTPRGGLPEFPKGFTWGVATAAYQIEGAVHEGGRKPSVWDTYSHTPGRVVNGDTGDVACGHYHRFEEDITLMAELGIKDYRFSVAWPRIVPEGRGKVNAEGLDFYSRLVDCLAKHGITPHVTLFHWDSPQALEKRYGSWRSREMANDFADYCAVTVKHLGDRVSNWFTMNEIACFTYGGYGVGEIPGKAPGTLVNTRKEVHQTVHHALLAHGLACKAIRAASPQKAHISVTFNNDYFVPIIENPKNIAATHKAFLEGLHNSTIFVPIVTGQYQPETLERLGADAPEIAEGDMAIIGQPIDSVGLNVYTGSYVQAADTSRGYEVLPIPRNYPNTFLSWLNIVPESIYWAIRSIGEGLGRKDLPITIAENGCASDDQVTSSGRVIDSSRIMYLRSYISNVQRAISEGYPVTGYFLWSFMDNFEWSDGYSKRFGIVYVDYATQQRIPKMSYYWYQQLIENNRVV